MAYQELKSYQQAVIVYDFTYEFCKKYIKKFSRTHDQMEQAARSGKQNIVEGTSVSKTWPATELKLLGVARGSFEELLEDYKDFLREKNLEMWDKEDERAIEVRRLAYGIDTLDRTNKTDKTYRANTATHGTDKTDVADKTHESYRSYKSYKSYKSYETYYFL